MNIKLFCLIHKECNYKRYFYQALDKDSIIGHLFHELKHFASRYWNAIKLPFDNLYNAQQFSGERKSKTRMLYENLVWCFKYKEACNYYFLYGLD